MSSVTLEKHQTEEGGCAYIQQAMLRKVVEGMLQKQNRGSVRYTAFQEPLSTLDAVSTVQFPSQKQSQVPALSTTPSLHVDL